MDEIALSMALLDTRDRLRFVRELAEDRDDDEFVGWVETSWLALLAAIERHEEQRRAVA